MDYSKRGITVFHRLHDNTDCKEVIDLIHRLILVNHLLIYAEEMLHAPTDLCFDIRILHMRRYFVYNLLHKFLSLHLPCVDLVYKVEENFRLRILKRQIVQFRLNLRDTKPLGDGRIDIHRLLSFLPLFLRLHELQRP